MCFLNMFLSCVCALNVEVLKDEYIEFKYKTNGKFSLIQSVRSHAHRFVHRPVESVYLASLSICLAPSSICL